MKAFLTEPLYYSNISKGIHIFAHYKGFTGSLFVKRLLSVFETNNELVKEVNVGGQPDTQVPMPPAYQG
jgi:hypothetical protein